MSEIDAVLKRIADIELQLSKVITNRMVTLRLIREKNQLLRKINGA